MINVSNWSARSNLAIGVDNKTTVLKLKFSTGVRFRVPDGDHFYLTIRSNGLFEHVKVLAVHGDELTVIRGQDNTTAQHWSHDSCVAVEWNPSQLCEYVQQCVNGTAPTSVAAGVYCLDCATCITVGQDGRITDIDGGKPC